VPAAITICFLTALFEEQMMSDAMWALTSPEAAALDPFIGDRSTSLG
jgi:hypothetical protein